MKCKVKTEYIQKFLINKEFRDYIIWGVISSIVNVGLFQLLVIAGFEYRIANIITLLFIKLFCYVTNKLFVFRTKSENILALLREIGSFFGVRIVTFFIDYLGVMLLIEEFGMNTFISKMISDFIVIISNYLFGRLYVFKNKGAEK